MKIAQISMYFSPITGGQQYYVRDLKEMFVDHGDEVLVVQGNAPTGEESGVVGVFNKSFFNKALSLLCHTIKMGAWVKFTILLFFNMSLLKKYDLLICHYPLHYLALWWHPNVIVVSHGVDWPDKRQYLIDHLKYISIKLMLLRKVKVVANDTEFLRQIGIRITPKDKYFQEVKKNIWFIPNCVDMNFFTPSKQEKGHIILVPRNFRRARGIHLAIEAFHKFSKRYNNYLMIIAGAYNPESSYYKFCMELIKKYQLSKKIQIMGSVSHEVLRHLYQTSKITLIPTLDFEGTSLSALESMSSYTPVISTKIGGLKDLPTLKAYSTAKSFSFTMKKLLKNYAKESKKQFDVVNTIFKLNDWKQTWYKVVRN